MIVPTLNKSINKSINQSISQNSSGTLFKVSFAGGGEGCSEQVSCRIPPGEYSWNIFNENPLKRKVKKKFR